MEFGRIDKPIAKKQASAPKKEHASLSSSQPKKIQFGTISASRALSSLTKQTFDALIDCSSVEDGYYMLLVDRVFRDMKILSQLRKDLAAVGIRHYVIVSSVSLEVVDSKDDQTANLTSFESNWRNYLEFGGHKCKAIIAFGRSIRVLIKSADIGYYDFFDTQFAPHRFFCGSAYVGGPDKWIYPVSPIDYVYPFKDVGQADFVNYQTRLFRRQLQAALADDMSLDSLDTRPIKIVDASSEDKIVESLSALMDADLLALDTETSGFDTFRNKLGTVQMTADGETSYFFEWSTLKGHKRLLQKVLQSAKRLVLANAKFDIRFLNANGLRNVWPTDDTTLLSHAMNSNIPKGLKPNTWRWCGTFGGYDDKLDMIKKKMNVDNYLLIPKPILMEYAAIDPVVTWRQLVAMEKWCHHLDEAYPNEKVPEWTIWEFYKEIMIPNLKELIKIEMNGVFFDVKAMEAARELDDKVISDEAANMAKLWNVSKDYEFSSTDKLGKLFEQLGWPALQRNAKGVYSTADDILYEYNRLGYPGIPNLKRYRSFNVAKNTFYVSWGSFVVHHEDGTDRVHQVTNPFGTSTFRHIQSTPNFQQIPSGGEISHSIKKFFCAPPSHEAVEVEDENGNKWSNSEYLRVFLKDGRSVAFEDLRDTDEIAGYDKSSTIYDTKSCWVY